MRFSLAAVVSAALAGFASAYTTPVGANPSGNPIYKPALNEIVPAGSPYTITWNPTTAGTVTLVLLRGPSTNILPFSVIAEKIPNSGTYSWTPSSGLRPDTTNYGIQLIVDATGAYQYTSQFGISNSMYSIAVTTVSSTSAKASAPVTQISDGQVQAGTTTLQRSAVSQLPDGQPQAPVTVATPSTAAISTTRAVSTTTTAVSTRAVSTTTTQLSPVRSTAAATAISASSRSSSPVVVGTGSPVRANSTIIQGTGSLRTSTFRPSGTSTGAAGATPKPFTGAAGKVAQSAGGALVGLGALVVFWM